MAITSKTPNTPAEPASKRRRLSPPSGPTSITAAADDDSSADELSREYHNATPTILKPLPSPALPSRLSSSTQRQLQSPQDPPGPIRQTTELPDEEEDDSPDELDHTHLTVPKRTFHPSHHVSSNPHSPLSFSHQNTTTNTRPSTATSHPDTSRSSTSPPTSTAISSSPIPTSSPPSSPHPPATTSTPPPSERPAVDYKPHLLLHGHKRPVSSVRFSPDGNYLASASADSTVRIHALPSGKLHHVHSSALAGLSTLAWNPTSTVLALGSDDLTIRLFHLPSLSVPAHSPLRGHHAGILSLAFSPRGNILASGSVDEALNLWCVRTGTLLKSLPAHSDPVSGVSFSHDGTLIASCATDGVIRIWDTSSGQCLRTFFGEETPAVGGVAFSPNSRFVVSWMLDSSVRLWDYVGKSGGGARVVKTYEGHVNMSYSISGCFGTYTLPTSSTSKPSFSSSSAQRNPANNDDTPSDDDDALASPTSSAHQPDPLPQKAVIMKRAFLATPSETGSIVLHDVTTKTILQTIANPGVINGAGEITGPGDVAGSGGKSQHQGVVFAVDAHPTLPWLASCGFDGSVRVWRDVTGDAEG